MSAVTGAERGTQSHMTGTAEGRWRTEVGPFALAVPPGPAWFMLLSDRNLANLPTAPVWGQSPAPGGQC
ncbi:hypothetical protein AAFF_G00213030 [Aldrovandia affinis]|uniref:Uncharacterized protein n=1 Tax=Aldrovandia affinis TaxID=143900 RepID=A0AAD7RGS8_9TELE|nr:hypothetical protein AAFF_G00213030 [Aldrovandia affinis]